MGVARDLARLIHTRRLAAGDRLPPQEELRQAGGYSNKTLSAAMTILTLNGMIRRKSKVGTVVVDPSAIIRGLWRVGLCVLPATTSHAFYAQLFHRVQMQLLKAQCTTTVFLMGPVSDGQSFSIPHFPALAGELLSGRLDAIMALCEMTIQRGAPAARTLPVVHAGSWEKAGTGVVIDSGATAERSVKLLASRGCRRLRVVSIAPPTESYQRFWTGFRRGMTAAGLSFDESCRMHGGEGAIGGHRVAEALLQLPGRRRPDGLIIVDDRVATGLTSTLAAKSSYRPTIVVQTNMQAPLAYALPVIHFQVDVDELAQRATSMLLTRLLDVSLPSQRQWLVPQLLDESPGHMVMSPQVAADPVVSANNDDVSLT